MIYHPIITHQSRDKRCTVKEIWFRKSLQPQKDLGCFPRDIPKQQSK